VIVCGTTGSGKTSLLRMALGLEPTPPGLTSDTKETTSMDIEGTTVIDTPGFLDNRKSQDPSLLFKGMLSFVAKKQLQVKKVFLCLSGLERLNADAVHWFADMAAATRADPDRLCVVLTKCDSALQVKQAAALAKDVNTALPQVTVITSGYQRVDEFTALLRSTSALTPLQVANTFHTSEELTVMLASVEKKKAALEASHQQKSFKDMSDKDRTIQEGEDAIRVWEAEINEAKRQNCPDHGLVDEANEKIKAQHRALADLRDDKISIAQSKANTSRFETQMQVIRDEFLKRNRWIAFFSELVPQGLKAVALGK